MNKFSISDLQQYSGIKAHTIRVWEQRYQALTPDRSEGNTRYYDSHQMRRLLNIVSLMTDNKVSELSKLSDAALNELISSKIAPAADATHEYYITQIIAAAIEYDEQRFDKLFANAVLRNGVKSTYKQILYPAITRIGLLWSSDRLRPAHEHFITNLIRQKLLVAIDGVPLAQNKSDSWLLFLPEDELHEIGLLASCYSIRSAEKHAMYLGANVPMDSLKAAVDETNPQNLLLFLVHSNDPDTDEKLIAELLNKFKKQKLFIACTQARTKHLKAQKNLVFVNSFDDLDKYLD